MTDYLDVTTETNVIATKVAAETLGALSSNMALMGLVSRDYDSEFAGHGQTVQIGIRGSLSANAKSEGSDVTVQAPTTTKKDITLNKHYEVTFGAEDIAIMLEKPDQVPGYANDASIALLEQAETDLAALYSGFSQTVDATTGLGEDDFREARRQLSAAKAPLTGRFAVLHEDADYELLGIERAVNRDYAESLGSALAAAYTTRFAGFDVFVDQNITIATSEAKNWFGHPDCAVLATRPMRQTRAPNVSQVIMSENGMGVRVTYSYDAKALADKMTLDVLYGVGELRDNHCVIVSTTEI